MTDFIKNYSLQNLKNKLIFLYVLNITDIISTLMLIGTGLYIEANVLMIKVVESPVLSFIIKVVFPAILFIFIYYRMQKATNVQLKRSNFLINCALVLYSIINISHILWFAMLITFILM